jgi:hypothetical protein
VTGFVAGHDCIPLVFPLFGEHEANLVARLKERRIPAGLSEVRVEVLMLGSEAFDQGHEAIGELRIELRASPGANFFERVCDCPRLSIGTPMRKGIEHIREGNDASMNGNTLP